jgi:Class II flagellar assembly regulator
MLPAMKIEWRPSVRGAAQRRDDRGAAADPGFGLALAGDAAVAAGATPGTMTVAGVAGLLSLQEVGDALGGRRRALAHGDRVLEALEELRLALLAGALPRAQILRLAHLAHDHAPRVDDPRLAEILAEIELRAAVEMAKLEQVEGAGLAAPEPCGIDPRACEA